MTLIRLKVQSIGKEINFNEKPGPTSYASRNTDNIKISFMMNFDMPMLNLICHLKPPVLTGIKNMGLLSFKIEKNKQKLEQLFKTPKITI
ncbi:hypothetical protein BpHYR1_021099 [Brachionus plicatilis]|uniref:Uncharacterized protein n=1 Tax=Brachionus plicatilis TaxID=10195 RepID=A0A3M7PE80_BRAPC|nr:hypothetical protein BpHYR1_021099 [Brachionus plicatilis]